MSRFNLPGRLSLGLTRPSSSIMPLPMEAARESTPQTRIKDLPTEQRRVIRAWCIYDWANSAFATSGLVAIFPVYFVFLFKEALGESTTFLGITFTGSSVWSLAIAIFNRHRRPVQSGPGRYLRPHPDQEGPAVDIHRNWRPFYRPVLLLRIHRPTLGMADRNIHARQRWIRRRPGLL